MRWLNVGIKLLVDYETDFGFEIVFEFYIYFGPGIVYYLREREGERDIYQRKKYREEGDSFYPV